jgi:translation elongation factor EF-G
VKTRQSSCLILLPHLQSHQVDSLFTFDSKGEVIRNQVEGTNDAWLELEEAVAMTDDSLLTEYLESSSLTTDQVIQGLKKGIREQKLLPMVFTSAEKNLGIPEMMDAVVAFLPNPVEIREDALKAG